MPQNRVLFDLTKKIEQHRQRRAFQSSGHDRAGGVLSTKDRREYTSVEIQQWTFTRKPQLFLLAQFLTMRLTRNHGLHVAWHRPPNAQRKTMIVRRHHPVAVATMKIVRVSTTRRLTSCAQLLSQQQACSFKPTSRCLSTRNGPSHSLFTGSGSGAEKPTKPTLVQLTFCVKRAPQQHSIPIKIRV